MKIRGHFRFHVPTAATIRGIAKFIKTCKLDGLMKYRLAALSFAAALAVADMTQACPKCRVAAGDLEHAEDSEHTGPFKGFSFALGSDFSNAYYYRGYLQQDRGVVIQPFLTASANFKFGDDLEVQPYIGWTNTFFTQDNADIPAAHSGGIPRGFKSRVVETPGEGGGPPSFEVQLVPTSDGDGWYESDVMAGVTIYYKDLYIDINYHVHIFPTDVHDAMQEIGGKISYDIVGLWDDTPALQRKFSLRPGFMLYHETSDQNGDQETFMEVSIEPIWRFEAFGRKAAVSMPIALSGSGDGYYVDADDFDTQKLGYFSTAIKGSISLPVDEKFGDWFLNGSITYLHLISDGLQEFNRGSSDEIVGSMGIGVSF